MLIIYTKKNILKKLKCVHKIKKKKSGFAAKKSRSSGNNYKTTITPLHPLTNNNSKLRRAAQSIPPVSSMLNRKNTR